jgi:CheY-like chemotaxis protein
LSLETVLVVDDESAVRQAVDEVLTSRGYEVLLAASGPEALATLETITPDVVLLDVTMPGMDGVEVLRRIVARHPSLPVIMVTGHVDIGRIATLLALGAVDYVPKPFDLTSLEQAVRRHVPGARDH